jgi:tetratricopeptide (TPR) repeat protein
MTRLIILLLLLVACGAQATTSKDPLKAADSLFAAGDYGNAVREYEQALKDKSNAATAQPWYRMGFSYHRQKDYTRAIAGYEKAAAINPRIPGLQLNLAKCYSATGAVTRSAVALDSAISQGFGNYKMLDSDADLENLRKDPAYEDLRSRAYLASHPCETVAAARQFDFWLGSWDVYQTANPSVKAGVNVISRQSGGCVLLESWESQGAHSGVSINYFDPANGKWKQKWAGSGQDITEFYDGAYADGAMRFRFDVPKADGTIAVGAGRLTFTNLEPGKVRQHAEQTTDGGKTWRTQYDFTYVLRK